MGEEEREKGEEARDTAFFLPQRHKLLPAEPVFLAPPAISVALEAKGWMEH